jgi:hypothetical protein
LWTYNHPIYGTRKSIEIGTIIGNKGYFVDYTTASSKFLDYLPLIPEMINSFEVTTKNTMDKCQTYFTNIESSGYKSC